MLKNEILKLKQRFLLWLCPGLIAEVNHRRWFSEAVHDIHILQLPYNEYILEVAFQNCRGMESALVAQKATLQDRQNSLLEILRRSKNG